MLLRISRTLNCPSTRMRPRASLLNANCNQPPKPGQAIQSIPQPSHQSALPNNLNSASSIVLTNGAAEGCVGVRNSPRANDAAKHLRVDACSGCNHSAVSGVEVGGVPEELDELLGSADAAGWVTGEDRWELGWYHKRTSLAVPQLPCGITAHCQCGSYRQESIIILMNSLEPSFDP